MPSAASPAIFDDDALPHLPAHKLSFQANGTGLAQHSAHFRVVTAVVNEVDVFFFQAGDQRGEIFPGGNTVEEDDVGVSRFQPVLDRTRQPFAILLFVVNDGDALGFTVSRCILPP